jgi:ABC-type hemin transport system substrate-binding protein
MPKYIRFIACSIVALLCSCTSGESEPKQAGVRIVSLSPSITASLIDMGFNEELVGRSAFCEEVGSAIPVVGDLYAVDYEQLLRLQPTHVFLQQQVGGIDSHLEELAENGAFVLRSWELNTIEDIKKLSTDLSTVFRIDQSQVDFEFNKFAISVDPTLLMTGGSKQSVGICFGRNTYLDDIWEAIGGVNALKKEGWQMLSLEDIARLSPSRILIVSDTHFTSRSPVESLGIPVIQFVHKDVLIPSTRIVQVAQSLQEQMVKTQ